MLLKNCQLAVRNLLRDKFYTTINIVGLAIGMAAALLLFIWVNNEYAYDNFHTNGDHLYRINRLSTFGGERSYGTRTALPLSDAAKGTIPEIEHISTVAGVWGNFKIDDLIVQSNYTKMVEPSYLKMFDFTFLQGNSATALNNPNSIILTETLANQLFGETDVLGRTIELSDKLELSVTGVIKDFPKNSYTKLSGLIPLKGNIEKLRNEGSRIWGSNNFVTYALLKPAVNLTSVENKLTALIPSKLQAKMEEPASYKLQLVKDIYLGPNENNVASIADEKMIRLFSIIGLLLLLIACINYVNLTTARAAHRAKSIGVQKIIGASKGQLFQKHLIEASCVVLVAGILSIALADFCLPFFEDLIGKELPNSVILSTQSLPVLIGTVVTAILLSGIQPALQLASFKPINALKGSQFKRKSGKVGLRKALVIGQFACSSALVICTLIMMQQIDFIQQSKLGFEKEHIFRFYQDNKKSPIVKNELIGQKGIEAVTLSNRDLVNVSSMYGSFTYEGMPVGTTPKIWNIVADTEFKDFFGLELKEGRWFEEGRQETRSYIINEAAAKDFQMDQAIGKWVDLFGRKGTIVGVLKDFHFKSFHHKIEPIIFEHNPNWYDHTFVKTTGEHAAAAIASVEKTYAKHYPNSIFEYEFLDDTFDNMYRQESQMSHLFSVFALLTIFISCLGILGLATYTAERRGKEISIRKVLGASVLNIVNLLSLDFLKLVFLSLIIAAPAAWYFMSDWLKDFAFSIDIGWSTFVTTALLIVLIAYFTIGFQSLRAALVNPAKTLKTE